MENPSEEKKLYLYRICVYGHLDSRWSDWFNGFTIEYQADITSLHGSVHDQAALHGLLAKIRDLGLELRLVELLENRKQGHD